MRALNRNRLLRALAGALALHGVAGLSSQALAQTAASSAQVQSGGKVYQKWCAECHNERGFGAVILQQRHQGAVPAILDQRRDLSGEVIGYAVRNGVSFMPFFRKTEITDAQLSDLSAYLTSDPEQRKKVAK